MCCLKESAIMPLPWGSKLINKCKYVLAFCTTPWHWNTGRYLCIRSRKTRTTRIHNIDIKGADDRATPGGRALIAMIFTSYTRVIWVLHDARHGLTRIMKVNLWICWILLKFTTALGRYRCDLKLVIFKIYWSHGKLFPVIFSQVNATRPHWGLVHTGPGDGLMPSSNKSLPEPMLAKFHDAFGVTVSHWVKHGQQLWVLMASSISEVPEAVYSMYALARPCRVRKYLTSANIFFSSCKII